MSERVAIKDCRDQCEVIEAWDANGLESREMGTFLHEQIESYLNGRKILSTKHFSYMGEFIKVDKLISIETELGYFKSFINDNKITSFRTEWQIFDLKHKFAGTVDLLCRNGEFFDLYDWKRSKKSSPNESIYQYGRNGLNYIPDISFYHYALQQNLYKYIIESNYGIKVRDMYIVIFHPKYETYKKFKIPNMLDEVNIILQYINNH